MTRRKTLVVIVGQAKALVIAIRRAGAAAVVEARGVAGRGRHGLLWTRAEQRDAPGDHLRRAGVTALGLA